MKEANNIFPYENSFERQDLLASIDNTLRFLESILEKKGIIFLLLKIKKLLFFVKLLEMLKQIPDHLVGNVVQGIHTSIERLDSTIVMVSVDFYLDFCSF